ncbi:MAG: DUF92 domain-containing protein [Oscillospiraceae bacterium]|jgi:uncharacterized protein (TIGR00297 family)|nr:DUF92 domain-containing protein [Oscillospiraceae bacterium]
MENSILGILLTVIVPFLVLGLASVVQKLGVSAEGSRKLVHILLSNWILLAIAVYTQAWAICILPACFIVLNYLNTRTKLFSAIERDEDNTLGTVWYAVSLFLLCLAGYSLEMPWLAACGMLAMGYGDGFGALVGRRFGKSKFPGSYSKKSLEGMVTVMIFSGLSVGIVCAIYAPDITPHFALYAALSCAVPAAAIELFTPRGVDNLTLPLGVSLIIFLLARFPFLWPVFFCLSIALLILIFAYYLKAITISGLISAIILGTTLFVFGGLINFAALVLFFVLGSIVSRIGKKKKSVAETLHERHGARSIAQVVANGVPSLLFAAVYYFTGIESCLIASIACFAATTADTFSSEIGMLSKKVPLSIITLTPIQRGISGGFTALGLFGGFLGAIIISALMIPDFGVKGMIIVAIVGFVSSILDSVLGALFQAKYQVPSDQDECLLTERKFTDGKPLKLIHGFKWVNNDVVNFASVFFCGLLLAIIWQFI